jgi:uncharacterized membrane protein YtjA (UPF0391 family)
LLDVACAPPGVVPNQTNLSQNELKSNDLSQTIEPRSVAMLGWAVTFLIIALVAAVLGFGGIAGLAVELAKIVFVVAMVLFVISAIFGFIRGRSPNLP